MSRSNVVLVSGGSRGLGLATVHELLKQNYRVATFSRSSSEPIEALRNEFGDRLWTSNGDMSDPESLKLVVDAVENEFGPIYGLVNNAGIAFDGVLAGMAPGNIEQLITVNLTGALLLTRVVLRRMILRKGGSIVNISSIIGLRGYSGLAAYSATKAGLDGISRALARELGSRQIRVNSLAPGYLETEMTHGLDDCQREQIVRRTPLGRLGCPSDVVPVILFLLSPESGFVTGQTLVVDGGITC